MKFTPAASMRTRTSPLAGDGVGKAVQRITSGPPCSVIWMACMGALKPKALQANVLDSPTGATALHEGEPLHGKRPDRLYLIFEQAANDARPEHPLDARDREVRHEGALLGGETFVDQARFESRGETHQLGRP